MARQLTTKAQVNGYRFMLRRLEHALVRRDVRMLHDPMRSQLQALLVGALLGVLVLAGCGVWGLVRPQGSVGDARIVVSKDGGGTYVRIDDTLHPVLNLASARLIAGSSETPKSVSDGKLAAYARGPLLGIPGAPPALHSSSHGGQSFWTVCDTATASPEGAGRSIELAVIGERPVLGRSIDMAGPDDAALVAVGGKTFLIYTTERDGKPLAVRAEVDTSSTPVMRGLRLEGAVVREMSAGLLNNFPEVDRLTVPEIDGAGGAAATLGSDVRVGSVVKSVGVDDRTSYYVVLRGGVQQISEATAEILRLADRDSTAPVRTVAPGRVAAGPMREELPVGDFPAHAPSLVEMQTAGTLCRSWSRAADEATATSRFLVGRELPLPDGAVPVRVSSADGAGPGVDQVYLRPGTGEYVQTTGSEPDSRRVESRYYISDVGIRYGVADAETGQVLGLGDTPAKAPWPVLSLLAAGPSLSRSAALMSHDGMAPDADAQPIPLPEN
ncbi:type VII secretion protein EccB [Gordonia sp. SID5947]|uniref:type VII secretion protein EccB n=1 Tax=Gordonia sp. SID5947 TaxID=2690315 RepID=UPI00136CF933|nr:type VII secretion protein EccB [Gordonia sp. SID5947]MYR04981.1 type VII secretion protein EccB [Gordonia sp. SID5947]